MIYSFYLPHIVCYIDVALYYILDSGKPRSVYSQTLFYKLSGPVKSLNVSFWHFDVHHYLRVPNVISSKHADVHLCEVHKLSCKSSKCRFGASCKDDSWLSLSGSSGLEFNSADFLHHCLGVNEEPFVCLECLLSKVSLSPSSFTKHENLPKFLQLY